MLTAVLARQAAAAVGVRTCWPWETAATLPSARRRKALGRPRGGKGRGHTVGAACLQLVFIASTISLRRLVETIHCEERYAVIRVANYVIVNVY